MKLFFQTILVSTLCLIGFAHANEQTQSLTGHYQGGRPLENGKAIYACNVNISEQARWLSGQTVKFEMLQPKRLIKIGPFIQ